MSIKATHPLYDGMMEQWELSRDSNIGQSAIKNATIKYLPPTESQWLDGYGKGKDQLGQRSYDAYLVRALYLDIYKQAVENAVGLLHRKPPNIQLPKSMESLETNATHLGESLQALMRRVNVYQVATGRAGLLGDFRILNSSVGKSQIPTIAVYDALSIRNWNDTSREDDSNSLSLVVLDQSGQALIPGTFNWKKQERYRVLALVDEDKDGHIYSQTGALFGNSLVIDNFDSNAIKYEIPELFGVKLETIPFSFVNSRDIAPAPDYPPLLGLAELMIAAYRGEADYRDTLFQQGQDTLVKIGETIDPNIENEPTRTGSNSEISVPQGGDAKYIGIDSQGLPEQRSALENDYARAKERGGQLLDSVKGEKESGEALKIRVSSQTTTLPQVAYAGATGLRNVLVGIAPWFKANPDEIILEPNLEFHDEQFDGQTLIDLVTAKTLGAPISEETVHNWCVENKITRLKYEEELTKIAAEESSALLRVPELDDD